MMEHIELKELEEFLKMFSQDHFFIDWKESRYTQTYNRVVVYPLYLKHKEATEKLRKALSELGLTTSDELEEEPLVEGIFEQPVEMEVEDIKDGKEKCPYCDRILKKGFGMKMHVAKDHKEKFDEWKEREQ